MKKSFSILLAGLMAMSMAGCASSSSASEAAGKFTAGTYTGTAAGKNGDVTVEVTVSADKIEKVEVTEQQETQGIADQALESVPAAIVDAQTPNVDTVSGATVTSTAIIEASKAALEQAGWVDDGTAAAPAEKTNAPVTYTAGTYTGTAEGYNGPVALDVTFSDDAITDIQINTSSETNHVGTPAFDILFADAKEANGSGIDSVSGATFTSAAIKGALNDAAEQAKASDLDAFKKNTVVHAPQEAQDVTYDVVVVGAGGAGMGAAVQAAQNGNSVLVIEENAEIGGNTLVSGGAFQSVMPYLVWDPENPDAKTAVWDYDGKEYDKVMSTQGNIDVLKTILNWSEEPFDEDYYKDHEFVAGDIDELSKHGVHAEYLPTLQALKKEIQAYLDWAQPQLDAGVPEDEITLFSTINLHIFQTYYGGLRPSADKSEWVYGDYDLVAQFINDGQSLKTWLEDQGAKFLDGAQTTLIGALWYRENQFNGGDLDGDGEPEVPAQWGTYFATTKKTLTETVANAADNKIMLRTKADNLIVEDGKVTGVHAVQFDGTEVTAHANKGVVLATGGFAANIKRVQETNKYWDPKFITDATQTTNRSAMQGDGIDMAEAAGAGETGMGWTQMMPISWVDNGDLAFGSGAPAIYVNPTTGKRFVNESAERDVLSLGEFENGVEHNGAQGVFLEFTNENADFLRPYPYNKYNPDGTVELGKDDVDGRVYFVKSPEELKEKVLDPWGMTADPEEIYKTIEAYDQSIIAGEQPSDGIGKSQAERPIGNCEKDANGSWDAGTYDLENTNIRVRIMAPSTHHTMGGLAIDPQRHVLTADGAQIKGLYAAGEVTGGIHGGNRLGGNAIVEIFTSGRTAANTIEEDNK